MLLNEQRFSSETRRRLEGNLDRAHRRTQEETEKVRLPA